MNVFICPVEDTVDDGVRGSETQRRFRNVADGDAVVTIDRWLVVVSGAFAGGARVGESGRLRGDGGRCARMEFAALGVSSDFSVSVAVEGNLLSEAGREFICSGGLQTVLGFILDGEELVPCDDFERLACVVAIGADEVGEVGILDGLRGHAKGQAEEHGGE